MNEVDVAEAVADVDRVIDEAVTVEPTPQIDHLRHFGMSFLINIPLLKDRGNEQYVKQELIQFPYFPRFRVLPFETTRIAIPPERLATYTAAGSPSELAANFDPDEAAGSVQGAGAFNSLVKSARLCANTCLQKYQSLGFTLFPSLTGLTYKEANDTIGAFLPLRDQTLFPVISRNVLGSFFYAPFLDQVLTFLQTNSPDLIERLPLNEIARDRMQKIYSEVLQGAESAWQRAKSIVEQTEAEMQTIPQEKSGYDRKDTRFVDAPEPLDLLCLAHLDRKPIEERPLAQAQALQMTANQPMERAAAAMASIAEKIGGTSPDFTARERELDAREMELVEREARLKALESTETKKAK